MSLRFPGLSPSPLVQRKSYGRLFVGSYIDSLMANTGTRGSAVFRKTEQELLRLASEQSSDAVHGFRRATRRLETLLAEFPAKPNRNQEKLLRMLSRIRRRAGKVRDVDVQLAALRGFKVSLEPRLKTRLIEQLLEARVQHERRLSKLLKNNDVREIRRRLRKASQSFPRVLIADPVKTAVRILGSVHCSAGSLNDESLHRYRLALKRARYAVELAPRSTTAEQLTRELKRLQDALGAWHDWMLLTKTASEHLGEVKQSPLVRALDNLTRGKFRDAVAALGSSNTVQLGATLPARITASEFKVPPTTTAAASVA